MAANEFSRSPLLPNPSAKTVTLIVGIADNPTRIILVKLSQNTHKNEYVNKFDQNTDYRVSAL
jgi:hypothetical protein